MASGNRPSRLTATCPQGCPAGKGKPRIMATTDPNTHTTSDSADSVRPLPGTDRASPSPGQEMERTVVVGIDGSDESRSALRWAVDYARRTDATVRAIAVWQQPLEFGMTAVPPPPRQAYEAEAEKWLTDALPTLEPTEDVARIRTRTEEGDPSSVLVDLALGADLLVLGNHGRGAVRGALAGSVAQRCAHRTPCPLVLVPLPAEQAS